MAGLTFADVANLIGTSERHAQTLMTNGTMKLRDIDKVVDVLHLDFNEILSEVARPQPDSRLLVPTKSASGQPQSGR